MPKLLGPCPVTTSCIRVYTRGIADNIFADIADVGVWSWDELLQAARESAPNPDTVRLRAFYAIELMYTQLLPMQFFAASLRDVGEELKNLRVPRTGRGVQLLCSEADKRSRHLVARLVSAKLRSEAQRGFALTQPAEAFKKLANACEVLAGCLRRGDLKGMTTVGECLGWSFLDSSQPELEVERMVRALLTVNPQNPIHPWESVYG